MKAKEWELNNLWMSIRPARDVLPERFITVNYLKLIPLSLVSCLTSKQEIITDDGNICL